MPLSHAARSLPEPHFPPRLEDLTDEQLALLGYRRKIVHSRKKGIAPVTRIVSASQPEPARSKKPRNPSASEVVAEFRRLTGNRMDRLKDAPASGRKTADVLHPSFRRYANRANDVLSLSVPSAKATPGIAAFERAYRVDPLSRAEFEERFGEFLRTGPNDGS